MGKTANMQYELNTNVFTFLKFYQIYTKQAVVSPKLHNLNSLTLLLPVSTDGLRISKLQDVMNISPTYVKESLNFNIKHVTLIVFLVSQQSSMKNCSSVEAWVSYFPYSLSSRMTLSSLISYS